jgi:hypothetical protein
MTTQRDRFQKNLKRVDRLIDAYKSLKTTTRRATVEESDILRAAVVFLHAAQEDYLRGIIVEYLAEKNNLNVINFSFGNNGNRTKQISLSDLSTRNNELTIGKFVQDQIEEHMQKVSFNKTDDIATWLDRLGVEIKKDDLFPQIAELIARRHKIVHEADLNEKSGKGHHSANPISSLSVQEWKEAVMELIARIDAAITSEELSEPSMISELPDPITSEELPKAVNPEEFLEPSAPPVATRARLSPEEIQRLNVFNELLIKTLEELGRTASNVTQHKVRVEAKAGEYVEHEYVSGSKKGETIAFWPKYYPGKKDSYLGWSNARSVEDWLKHPEALRKFVEEYSGYPEVEEEAPESAQFEEVQEGNCE